MSRGFIARIFKTKLAVKIWLYMVLPTLAILLFIDVSLSIYFNKYSISRSIHEANTETSYVASSFSETYTDILRRFVRKTSSSDFKTESKKLLYCNQSDYTEVNNALQNIFTDYTEMNNLIESALFARISDNQKSNLLFYSYNCRLKKDTLSLYLSLDLSKISGITVLPHTASPFSNQPEVIPIVIPLKYIAADNVVLIAESAESIDVMLFLYLSTTKVNNYLELYCNDRSQGTMYLVNSYGQNMSLPSNRAYADTANSKEQSAALASAIASDETYFQSNNNHFYTKQIGKLDLYLVNVIPYEVFASKSHNISIALFWTAIISVFIITCLSFMISIFVTKPLKKLMGFVLDIEMNVYSGKANITAKDEIGQLSSSIDSMYNTIQQQILSIKEEEKEIYNTKMQLLSEQINPHFLYNALEFINMEVYNNHTENVSSMISSLGDYLRISLAYGENQLLIMQELEQVKAYVNIMNFRFQHQIQVTAQIPENLLYQKILKSIMQPLVENSLKHGFKVGISNGFPISPMIDISITLDDNHLTLSISDNGAGIDIDKATQIMLNKHTDNSPDKHLGLNNIYERLTAFYGEVNIKFYSIPFFENKVIIVLPAHFFRHNHIT